MSSIGKIGRLAAATIFAASATACSTGNLGSILGSVLGGGTSASEVSGSVQSVDTRNQQITVQQTNGENVALAYDNQTAVVYQNQNYPVTALQNGDQITAQIQQMQNGGYYTGQIQVNQSVSSNLPTGSGTVQAFEGTVQSIDRTNGSFVIENGNSQLTVSMPFNARATDSSKFRSMRRGDYVRLYGTFVANNRVQLSQFY